MSLRNFLLLLGNAECLGKCVVDNFKLLLLTKLTVFTVTYLIQVLLANAVRYFLKYSAPYDRHSTSGYIRFYLLQHLVQLVYSNLLLHLFGWICRACDRHLWGYSSSTELWRFLARYRHWCRCNNWTSCGLCLYCKDWCKAVVTTNGCNCIAVDVIVFSGLTSGWSDASIFCHVFRSIYTAWESIEIDDSRKSGLDNYISKWW